MTIACTKAELKGKLIKIRLLKERKAYRKARFKKAKNRKLNRLWNIPIFD